MMQTFPDLIQQPHKGHNMNIQSAKTAAYPVTSTANSAYAAAHSALVAAHSTKVAAPPAKVAAGRTSMSC